MQIKNENDLLRLLLKVLNFTYKFLLNYKFLKIMSRILQDIALAL